MNKSDGATVSVIVPTYQREEAIERAIRSVLGQRGIGQTAIEILVLDDGSTDGTEAVVKSIEAPPPHRIVYTKLEHLGQPGLVRNEGLAVASGDYIGYCDSDDIWLPHHLATCLRQFQLYPDSVMVETWWSFQTREKSLDRWKIEYQKASTDGRTTTTNSRLHRRDVLTRSGVFGDLRWGEDIDLWTRISFVGPIRRIKIPTTAHSYTRFGDNLTFEFCPEIGQLYHGVRSLPPPQEAPQPAAPAIPRFVGAPVDHGAVRALNVTAGTTVRGAIPGHLVRAGEIVGFGVEIGTHMGESTGELVVEIVANGRRVGGRASLEGAADNAILMMALERPLAVSDGEALDYTIDHPNGTDVVLWLSPPTIPGIQLSPHALGNGEAARWTIEYRTDAWVPPAAPSATAVAQELTMRQLARRMAVRVIPAPIKQNPTFRRTAFWMIDKLRPRP